MSSESLSECVQGRRSEWRGCGQHVGMRLRRPSVVTVVLAQILVLARGRAEVNRIRLASASLVPFAEQGDTVLHHKALSAFEAQQPVSGIPLAPAARATREIHPGSCFWSSHIIFSIVVQ